MVVMWWWLAPPILSRGLRLLLTFSPPKQWIHFFSSGKFHPPGCPPREFSGPWSTWTISPDPILAITSSCCRVSNNKSYQLMNQPFLISGMLVELTSFLGYMLKVSCFSKKSEGSCSTSMATSPRSGGGKDQQLFQSGNLRREPGNF